MSGRPSPSPAVLDAVLALAVVALAEGEILTGSVAGPKAASIPIALLLGLALAARRRSPLGVAAVLGATFPLQYLLGVDLYNYLATVVAGLVVVYTVAAHLPLRLSLPALGWLYGLIAVSALRGAGGLAWGAILIGGGWLAGYGIRERRLYAETLAELARELEAARDENARSAVASERARIARELHDVVAHAVSVMVVQAGAADQVLAAAPQLAREPLRSVQETGRQALGELRRLLGVLRTEEAVAALGPQPGLGELGALARQVQEAGLPVTVRVEGRERALSPGLDLAAYRIVQEALTNVLKHARATNTEVAVRYRGDAVEVEVLDDGRGSPGRGRGGHGLVGMRERAAVYGGDLEAGPRPGGGFAVRARLPLAAGR